VTGEKTWSWCFMGTVSVWEDGTFWRWMVVMVRVVYFMLYIFYHNFKNQKNN
jgi:hypothetical protein